MPKLPSKRRVTHVQTAAKRVKSPATASPSQSLRNPTADAHRKILPLLKKREQLQVQMARLDDQIAAALRNQTPGPIRIERRAGPGQTTRTPLASGKKAPGASKASLSPKAGSKHGMLKESILSALKKAGRKGLSVGELSAQAGVLKANIQVWFSSTGRKVQGLEKVERGRWRYTGRR